MAVALETIVLHTLSPLLWPCRWSPGDQCRYAQRLKNWERPGSGKLGNTKSATPQGLRVWSESKKRSAPWGWKRNWNNFYSLIAENNCGSGLKRKPKNYSEHADFSFEEEHKCCQSLVLNPQIALDRRRENTKAVEYDFHVHSLLALLSPLNIWGLTNFLCT